MKFANIELCRGLKNIFISQKIGKFTWRIMMTKNRLAPTRLAEGETQPFASPDEAWLWGMQGAMSRLDGARMKAGMATIPRPCEASDLMNCVNRLHRQGALTATQMEVLFLYGRYAVAPWMLGEKHRSALAIWQSAMGAMQSILDQKGIIESTMVGIYHAG
jgi:hypothetical protein